MDAMSAECGSSHYLVFQESRQRYAALRELMHRIGRLLAEQTGSIEQVGALLGELGDQLIKRFALEESHGYLGDALVEAPRLVRRANDLLHQHPKMEAAAKLLTQSLDQAQASRQWWSETERRFKAFSQEFLEHERSEDRLLQEAYSLDVEASD
jgi:hypothetical protein